MFMEFFANLPGMSPLLCAAYFGHISAVRLLLRNKAEITATNDYRRTALIMAAMTGHEEVVRILLDVGVPIDATDSWGRSALMWAMQRGHAQVAKMPLQASQPPRAKTACCNLWSAETVSTGLPKRCSSGTLSFQTQRVTLGL